jgi:hypothetical protein
MSLENGKNLFRGLLLLIFAAVFGDRREFTMALL